MHGTSFAASLTDGAAPEHRTQQYFETIGNRGMYKDGWWLAMKTERIPWVLTPDALKPYAPGVWDPDAGPAELYYLPDDFSQAKDLAADHPEKVQELKDLFWEEAERYKVLPLLATLSTFFGLVPPIPEETTFEFRGDVQNVLSGMIPRIYNRSYSISADLVVPEGGAEGVIVAEADHLGGFTLYVKDGKLTHTYSMMGVFVFKQVAEENLPSGEVTVRMEFEADGATPATGGAVTLYIDDRPVGKGRMDHTVPDPLLGLRGDGHRPRQRRGRRPRLRGREAVRVHRHGEEGGVRHQAAPLRAGRAQRAHRRAARPAPRTPCRHDQRREENSMTIDDETTDVLIGGYLSTEAAHEDYEAVLGCGAHLWGAVVVSKDLEGNVSLEQTDHTVEEGAAGLGGVGLVVGLFAPRCSPRPRSGRRMGAVGGKALHKKIGSGIEKMAEETIPIGGAGLIVAYPHVGGREGRTGRDARGAEGRRRSRGQPREGAEGRARRRPAEDGRAGGQS